MTLKTRIGILIAFALIFLTTAPVTVLYTAGYRWNFKKHRVEKIGILFVRSRPNDAAILLNGIEQNGTTPTRVRNLLPGTYTVRVQKNDYLPWNKQLTIESEKTTFAEGIVLFRDTTPSRMSETNVLALTDAERAQLNRAEPHRAPNEDETVATDGFELWIEHADDTREVITRLSEEIVSVLPYPNAPYILYQTKTALHAIERDNRNGRNDVVLGIGENMSGMAIDSRGATLYFKTMDANGEPLLWERPLQ